MAGHEPAIRAATALMADGINLKRRARGAIALKAEKAASVALDWLSNNTDGFVDATPQGACPELRFEMAAGAMLTSSKAYGRTDPPPAILGGGLDRDMAALTTSSPLKRREGELGDTSPHPAHRCFGVVLGSRRSQRNDAANIAWLGSTKTTPPLGWNGP